MTGIEPSGCMKAVPEAIASGRPAAPIDDLPPRALAETALMAAA